MRFIVACTQRRAAVKDKVIYLDNAATTIANSEVLDAYVQAKRLYFANASSIHIPGQEANRMLEKAREQILNVLSVKNHELIFTSGATEANNLAIKGYCLKHKNRGKHIIVSRIEHPSVLECAKQLEEEFGFEVTYLPVDRNGVVEVETLKNAIRKDTILVSIMAVNNEIGSINPIHDVANLLSNYKTIAFHVDATQGIGKIILPLNEADMISFSGHKIHGLNSSGALIKRKKIELLPIMSGGGQEGNLRSGTNDVALAVSLAKAVRLENEKIDENCTKISAISQYLKSYLLSRPDLYELNSGDNPYIVNFSTLTKKASVIVEALSTRGIMVSSTSACHAKEEPISYVVQALGKSDQLAHNTIRVSLSYENTLEDIKKFIEQLENIIKEIKQ